MTEDKKTIIDRYEIMKQIGINLTKLKNTMGWTQAKMAEITGLAEPTLANYLKGDRLPGIDFLIVLCAMPEIKKKGIYLNIDDFLSSSFDPERAQIVKNDKKERLIDIGEHSDFIGTYICYLYDQSKTVYNDDSKTNRELRL